MASKFRLDIGKKRKLAGATLILLGISQLPITALQAFTGGILSYSIFDLVPVGAVIGGVGVFLGFKLFADKGM